MPAHPKYEDPQEIISVIEKNSGVVKATAEALGVHRDTLRNYRQRWPEVEAAFRENREGQKDMVETVLYTAALNGEPWAVQMFLKTQAKDRGYVERIEVDNVVREELESVVALLEEGLEPEEFRKVTSILASKLG